MVKNFGKKAMATGLLLTTLATNLSAKPGDNDFGRESNFKHPKTVIAWDDFDVVTEFDYVSQRPDSEDNKALGGVTHTYEILRKGDELAIREKGKDVLIGTMNYWDINQNKERGAVEKDARDNGYLTDFTPDFTNAFYSALLGVHDSSIENERAKNQQSKGLEETVNGSYPNISLLFGGFGGFDSKRGAFGGIEAGAGVDFSKYFGINVLGRFAFGEDGKVLREMTTAESASGIYGYGTEVQEGYNMPGIALDLKVGANGVYGSVGAGLTFENSNDKTTESIMRGEDVLKSNETYSQNSEISPELRLGVGYTADSGFGASLNYSNNFNGRQSGGLNVTIPLGKTSQEKGLLKK